MKAFFYINHTYVTKNKLEAAVYQYLKSIDRTLVDRAGLPLAKDSIIKAIEKLNELHPKCKPIEPHWYESGQYFDLPDFALALPGICNFCCKITKDETAGPNNSQLFVKKA